MTEFDLGKFNQINMSSWVRYSDTNVVPLAFASSAGLVPYCRNQDRLPTVFFHPMCSCRR
jgi:hypothetical protein